MRPRKVEEEEQNQRRGSDFSLLFARGRVVTGLAEGTCLGWELEQSKESGIGLLEGEVCGIYTQGCREGSQVFCCRAGDVTGRLGLREHREKRREAKILPGFLAGMT